MQAYCFHMNEVFANCSDKDEIYPLTTVEIAEARRTDASLKHLFKRNAVIDQGLEIKLIENMTCVCKDGWLVIPKPLQVHTVKWYHHYLQHPGHTRLKETMNAAMYWMKYALVGERIGGWYSILKEKSRNLVYCFENKVLKLCYGSVWSMFDHWQYILPMLPLSFSQKEN